MVNDFIYKTMEEMKPFPRLAHLRGCRHAGCHLWDCHFWDCLVASEIATSEIVWSPLRLSLLRSSSLYLASSSLVSTQDSVVFIFLARGSSIDSNTQFSQTGKYVKCAWEIKFGCHFHGQPQQVAGTSPQAFFAGKNTFAIVFRNFDDCTFVGNFRQDFFTAFFDAMIQLWDWKSQLSQRWHKTPTAYRLRK